jgi:sulfopyruvate decarboxylase TPP-binding subunit
MLLVVTWRGEGGKDAPEHLIMGEVCPKVLETAQVPYRTPSVASLEADLAWAARTMAAESRPVALLLRPGVIE